MTAIDVARHGTRRGSGGSAQPESATRAWLLDAARRVAVVGTGTAVVAVAALPDPSRPVLVAAGLALASCLAAAAFRWRLVGTAAVLMTTLAVLLAGALDVSDLRPAQLIAAAAGLVGLVAALAQHEDARGLSPHAATAAGRSRAAVLARTVAALAAGAVVAVVASQDVVSSVVLVLLGLVAVVGALVVAADAHRGETRNEDRGDTRNEDRGDTRNEDRGDTRPPP